MLNISCSEMWYLCVFIMLSIIICKQTVLIIFKVLFLESELPVSRDREVCLRCLWDHTLLFVYRDALHYVQQRRFCINPNDGFAQQLMVSTRSNCHKKVTNNLLFLGTYVEFGPTSILPL